MKSRKKNIKIKMMIINEQKENLLKLSKKTKNGMEQNKEIFVIKTKEDFF